MGRKRSKLTVTDHAVVRYLEHSLRIDVDHIRAEIARKVEPGLAHGAPLVAVDGVRFVLRRGAVITALPKYSIPRNLKFPEEP